MKKENVWMLNYCVPVTWTNDLTPPGGEWDYETNPNAKFDWSDFTSSLSEFVSVIGKGFTAYLSEVEKQFGAVAELVNQEGYYIYPIIDEMADVSIKLDKLDEEELVKNGRHIVKSQKPGITLPARMTNSGPPERRKRK